MFRQRLTSVAVLASAALIAFAAGPAPAQTTPPPGAAGNVDRTALPLAAFGDSVSSDLVLVVALSAAVGVLGLLILLTKLVRAVKAALEFNVGPPRLPRRSSPPRVEARPVRHLADEPNDSGPEPPALIARIEPYTNAGKPAPVGAEPAEVEPASVQAEPSPAEVESLTVAAQMLAPPVPPERSVTVKQFRMSKVEKNEHRAKQQAGEAEAGAPDGADYGQVGEQVAAVLTAAEQAAAQIRESAQQEADQTRRDADELAAAARADAEKVRAEANTYSDQARAAADAYVEEKRNTADEQAATRLSEIEEQARAARADAERKASEVEAEALERRDMLRETAKLYEDRIEALLNAVRGVSSDLEDLLPKERQEIAEEADVPEDDALEQALRPGRPGSV